MQTLENTVFKNLAPKTINHVHAVEYDAAEGMVADIYKQMQRDYAVTPPITIHSPLPQVMAGVWSVVRESMMAGPVDRAYREAVSAAVAKINECPFCLEAHTGMMKGASAGEGADMILQGTDRVEDPKMNSIIEWGAANRSPESEILRNPPFAKSEAPEYIGTAVSFHHINRMVNVFLDESPLYLPSGLGGLRGIMSKLFDSVIAKRIMQLTPSQGDSLKFLPKAVLPEDLSWAASNPAVAGAFAGFASVIEDVQQKMVPKDVRDLVHRKVDLWKGEEMGLSRSWLEEAVRPLSDLDRPVGRLALLTALASYQVDEKIIQEFRQHFPGDDYLIGVTAWASFTAARKVGTWL